MIRGLAMIAAGLSGLILCLKELNLIQIPGAGDMAAVSNTLHQILVSIRSFFQ
jgi:hypothetical protein